MKSIGEIMSEESSEQSSQEEEKNSIPKNTKQQTSYHPKKKDIFGNDKPFRLLLAASSGSGKSQLIKSMMTDKSWGIKQRFQCSKTFIICPTLKVDSSYDDIIKDLEDRQSEKDQFQKNEQCFDKNLEQSLAAIYEDIIKKNSHKKDNKSKLDEYLIICDDVLLEIDLSSAHSQIARMLTKCRHYKISMIISTQYLKSMHPISRSQLSHFISFNTSNAQEEEKIKNEVCSGISKKQFQSLFQFCVDQPYHYMLVILGFPVKYRFFRGCGPDLQQIEV